METNNPYQDELKDPRLKLIDSFCIGNTRFLTYYLEPNDKLNCPVCQSSMIIKYGSKNRKVNAQIFKHTHANITIKYHRFKCNKCGKLFVDECKDVERSKTISKQTKLAIMYELREDVSLTKIANNNNVSTFTVISILKENVSDKRLHLPETMCIDEFKNLKSAEGKYAFLIYSPMQHKIVDVLSCRNKELLENYFYDIDFQERMNVKYIVSDMYDIYRDLAKRFFPEATYVVDSFHYIRYVTGAFQDIRIGIQKKLDKKSKEYNMLKNNWRLLTLDTRKISSKPIYNYMRHKHTSPSEYLNDALSISPILEKAHEMLQSFYDGWRKVKYEHAEEWLDKIIEEFKQSEFKEYAEVAKTLKNWKTEILNSFIRFGDKRLNNEYIEGINNHIKEIKKVGYGFKDFDIFKKRIMYIINGDGVLINK